LTLKRAPGVGVGVSAGQGGPAHKCNDCHVKTVFWHSSAHMLGEVLEHSFGVRLLTIGPALAFFTMIVA
jgi:hypothetical protein